jgi:hypothetical protein
MARKRIRDLDAQASIVDTLKLAVDDTGMSAAKRVSISQLDARYSPGLCYLEWYQNPGESTSIAVANTFQKINVTSAQTGLSAGSCLSVNSQGRITNTGDSATFSVSAAISVGGTNNDDVHFVFAVNGVVQSKSEQSMVLPSGARDLHIGLQALLTLNTGQYIDIYVKNVNDTHSVNLGSINVVAQKIG